MLDTAINELNHIYTGKAFIQTAFDYEGFRSLHNGPRTQDSIIEYMLKLNKEFDILIYCPLVDGEFGSGMKLELDAIKEANKRINAEQHERETDERLIDIEPFVKERDDFSENDYPELMDKGNTQLEVCHWYKNDDDFLNKAYKIINTVVAPLLPIASDASDDKVDDADGGKESDDEGDNKKNHLLHIIVALLLIALGILLLLNWDKINKFIYRPIHEEDPAPVVDSAGVALNQGIDKADSLICLKQYDKARVILDDLKKECPDEWPEMCKIDSLSALATTSMRFQGQQEQKKGKNDGQAAVVDEDTIEDNTFEIIGAQNPLRGYLSNYIKKGISRLSKPSDGKKERWTVSIEQDLSALEIPKIIESDEYQIDIEYGIKVKDNLTGKVILENTVTTRGRSTASLEDAKKHSRQLAAEEIAEQIKQCIQ